MSHWLDNDDWELILKDKLLPSRYIREEHLDARDAYTAEALQSIIAGSPVRVTSSGLVIASVESGHPAGIAVEDADGGRECSYISRGFVFLDSWLEITGSVQLVTGKMYFLSQVGKLSTTPPDDGYLIPMGRAQSTHLLDVSIGPSIKL